jgi:hypothetical protein
MIESLEIYGERGGVRLKQDRLAIAIESVLRNATLI